MKIQDYIKDEISKLDRGIVATPQRQRVSRVIC